MRHHRILTGLGYSFEEQEALLAELSESKRLDQEERDYEDSCDTHSDGILRGAQETLVEPVLVEGVRIP
jgi:hypothetical protein